jgi:uncharacterized protein (TIGR03435 family)
VALNTGTISGMKLPLWIAALVCSGLMLAQEPAGKKLSFEVASVKPADPNPVNPILVGMKADPAIVRYGNLTLRDWIRGAYTVRDFQIVAPAWMSNARFDVEARLPAGATTDQIAEMMQSLIEERFKLTLKRDSKEMQVYALVVGPGGAKLKPTELKMDEKTPTAMGTDGKPRPLVYWRGNSSRATVSAPGANLLALVGVLTRFTAKPVVDATGIEGRYDFEVTFAPEVAGGLPQVPDGALADPAPVLADAVKALGLRIENRKMPMEQLIVDHIERTPAEN